MVTCGMSKTGKLGSVIISGHLWKQYKWKTVAVVRQPVGVGVAWLNGNRSSSTRAHSYMETRGPQKSNQRTLTLFTFFTIYLLPVFLSFHSRRLTLLLFAHSLTALPCITDNYFIPHSLLSTLKMEPAGRYHPN